MRIWMGVVVGGGDWERSRNCEGTWVAQSWATISVCADAGEGAMPAYFVLVCGAS